MVLSNKYKEFISKSILPIDGTLIGFWVRVDCALKSELPNLLAINM